MHEFALGETRRTPIVLDPDLISALRDSRAAIEARSLLNWAEHCSECAMPECYATCSLYTPRPDFKCRRFDRGIQGRFARDGEQGGAGPALPLMSVTFRQWGKLEARGDVTLVRFGAAEVMERGEPLLARLLDNPFLPLKLRRKALKAGDLAKGVAARAASRAESPDVFLLEVINSGDAPIPLTFTAKSAVVAVGELYQASVLAAPGYNRLTFPAADILRRVGEAGPFLFQVEPIAVKRDMPALHFGIMDFVKLRAGATLADISAPPVPASSEARASAASSKVKCVVWDLDNTLWSGTLVEDGPDGVRLNPKAAALVVELDRRGILNSIASKNSGGVAEALLERFGLAEYFLYPQIHWEPKSRSVQAIARSLNIGIDSLVLVDDQIFERAEVQHAHPSVEVFDVDILDAMLDHPRFDVPVTEESRQRRSMYKVEQARMAILEETGGDYAAFLRGCDLELVVTELDAGQMNRVFELTERTNQLNYSGRRLSRADLQAKLADPDTLILVLAVSDRFGDYGVVGVAVLNLPSWTVECFFMSCRVQRKKVENAFFAHLMEAGRRRGEPRLSIVYRPTARNEPSREVLADEMKFRLAETGTDERLFQLDVTDVIADHDIVTLHDRSRLAEAAALEPA
ncbi:MAG TPA: HAD-IIIC family phosphatase [Caulobacteraceae bacterium]|nr:HAD-IIIC family phosphatase [Caulobacteraceae bacterium]